MIQFSSGEWLFYGGLIGMAAAAALAGIGIGIFFLTGRRLKRKLKDEYGDLDF